MYDFYPEWGPARNRDEDDAPEAWDGSGQQPDDN